jgi:predicted DNA-binding transcriptional regulator
MNTLQAYEEKLKNLLDSLNAQIESVQSYALRLDESTRLRLSAALEKLGVEHRSLQAQVASLHQAGEAVWMDQVASTQQNILGAYLLLTSILMDILNITPH